MMWPRLLLLHELLGDAGSIWITLDDNEIHRARGMLDSIFGEHNIVATCIWHKNYSPKPSAQFFSEDHDYPLIYAKDKAVWRLEARRLVCTKLLQRWHVSNHLLRQDWQVNGLCYEPKSATQSLCFS